MTPPSPRARDVPAKRAESYVFSAILSIEAASWATAGWIQSARRAVPSERLTLLRKDRLRKDRLLAIRADGNNRDTAAQQFTHHVEICSRRTRQVGQLAGAGDIPFPA